MYSRNLCVELNFCFHIMTLQWCHNEHDGVSNHQPHDCLLNRLFRRRSKKTSKLRVTGLCAENSPVNIMLIQTSIFKGLEMLKVKDIFDVQCLKLWYKFVNNELPYFFKSMLTYNHELYETETRSHGMLHVYPTRTAGARNVVRHRIPELLLKFQANLMRKVRTHSISTFVSHVKSYIISSYSSECIQMNCYICQRNS